MHHKLRRSHSVQPEGPAAAPAEAPAADGPAAALPEDSAGASSEDLPSETTPAPAGGVKEIRSLLESYDPEQPPPVGPTGHVEGAFAFSANKLMALDHQEQTLQVVGWLRYFWYDPRLKYTGDPMFKVDNQDHWDSKEDSLPVDTEAIWTPDVRLINALDFNWEELCDNVPAFVYDDSEDNTVETNQGLVRYNVKWVRPCVLTAKCDIDLKWFPFDTTVCPLKFMAWADTWMHFHLANEYHESRISLPEF